LREDFLALETAWLKLARLRERDLSDRIRERAYEIWIAGGSHGDAEQDWLAAEQEILSALQSSKELGRVPAESATSDAETEIINELRQSLSERKSGDPIANSVIAITDRRPILKKAKPPGACPAAFIPLQCPHMAPLACRTDNAGAVLPQPT